MAYPLVGAEKLAWAAQLCRRAQVTLCVDDVEAARQLASHFAGEQREADVHLLIDSGFGRCGVLAADALGVAAQLSATPGIRLTGILTHEGHAYAAEDRADLELRSRAAALLMVRVAQDLRRGGLAIRTVSLGSSASAPFVVEVPGVSQVRPGIYAFNDMGQVALGNATLDRCAARVLSTVISRPAPDRALLDAGSKSLSSDGLPPLAAKTTPGFGLIVDQPGWQLHRLSEEHGWVRWVGDGQPGGMQVGDRVQIIPNHICTAFSSSGSCVAVRGGEIEGNWRTIPRRTAYNREEGWT